MIVHKTMDYQDIGLWGGLKDYEMQDLPYGDPRADELIDECCKELYNIRAKLRYAGIPAQINWYDNRIKLWEYSWAIRHTPLTGAREIIEYGAADSIFAFLLQRILAKRGQTPKIHSTDLITNFMPIRNRMKSVLNASNIENHFADATKAVEMFDYKRFDVVFAICTLEHIPDFQLAIKEMGRICKVDGRVTITIDFKNEKVERTCADRLFTPDDIASKIVPAANKVGLKLINPEKFHDGTNWDNPPINLGDDQDEKYTMASLFFEKVCPCEEPTQRIEFTHA